MYEPQHFVDLQNNAGYRDPKSWLSGEDHSPSQALHRTLSSLYNAAATGASGNVDRVLFNDLVEIVPLVQSLIDRKAKSSFIRRGSMIYTKTPSRESLHKKTTEPKGRTAAQSIPTKKQRDQADKDEGKNACSNQDGYSDSFSAVFSRASPKGKDREELIALREQLEDLQRKLLDKDELLKSAEISKTQMTSIHAKLEKLKEQAAEKDSLIKSAQLHLSDTKDDRDEIEKQKMEAAIEAYIAAVAAAKEKQDEGSIAAAASARLHLQSFVFRTNGINPGKGSL